MLKFSAILLLASMVACGGNAKDSDPTTDSGTDTEDTDTDTDTEDTDTEDTDTDNQSSTGFIDCSAHTDCGEDMFCSVQCFQGPCGDDDSVNAPAQGNYCQPCVECEQGPDAIDGSCAVCED
jgi:hypothetical protein